MSQVKNFFFKAYNSPTITSWAVFGVRFFDLLIVIPLILKNYGQLEIAIFLLFESIFQLSSLITKRIKIVLTRVIAFAFAGAKSLGPIKDSSTKIGDGSPNYDMLSNVYSTSGMIFLGLGVLAATICFVAGWFGLTNLQEHGDSNDSFWLLLISVTLLTGLQNFLLKYDSYLYGLNEVSLANRWTVVFRVSSVLILPVLISLDYSIELIIITLFAIRNITEISKRFVLIKGSFSKQINFSRAFGLDRDVLKGVFEPSWKGMVSIISSKGIAELSGVIITGIYTPEFIAVYLFGLRIINATAQFSQAPFSSLNPLFSKLRAEKRLPELSRKLSQRIVISLGLFSILAMIIAATAQPVLTLIDSNIAFVDRGIWLLWTLVFLLEMHIVFMISVCASGNYVIYYWHDLICAIISLALLNIIPAAYGILGIIIALSLPRILIFNIGPLVSAAAYIKMNAFRLANKTLIPVFITHLGIFVLYYILK